MKKFFSGIIFALTLIFFSQSFALAAEQPKGIPAGGKGATEAAAIEDMQVSTIKKVLAQITSRSEDSASPYQQLLKRYKEFIGSVKVEKKGKTSNGAFVTGRVIVKYPELQDALKKIVKSANTDEDTRKVYVFVRFVSDGAGESQAQAAESRILDRYITRLNENKFDVANADEVVKKLSETRSMNFEKFVEWFKKQSLENPEISTAVVGEIRMAQLEKDDEGYTASCEIYIRALDCFENFKVIDNYEGSDVLRMNDINRVGQFMLEKAAVTSSKAITDSLVTYWSRR